MNLRRPWARGPWAAAAFVAFGWTACLSTGTPAPPVRVFDALPAAGAEPRLAKRAVDLRVSAAAHLGRELVVRVAPREVAFDGQHRWLAEPSEVLAAACRQGLRWPPASAPLEVVELAVVAFELDVTGAPAAHVRCELRARERPVTTIDCSEPAGSREPAALAAAMAKAVESMVARIADAL